MKYNLRPIFCLLRTIVFSTHLSAEPSCITAINIKDAQYGAKGDGLADDTTAILSAISSVNASTTTSSTLFFPRGVYRVSSTLTISRSNITIYGDDATILVDHNGTGVELSNPAGNIFNISIMGNLTISKNTLDSSQGSIGLKLRNTYTSQLRNFRIKNFNYGVYILGDASGCVYNLLEPSELYNNQFQMFLTTNNGGWSNQNTIIGGRWWYNNLVSNPTHIYINNNGYTSNGNTFIHTSLEGSSVTGFAVQCDGSYNTFMDLRTEGGTAYLNFGANSNRNAVLFGTYINPSYISDAGTHNQITLIDGNSFRVGKFSKLNPIDNGIINSIIVGSTLISEPVGIFLPIADGTQNTRAWLKLDATAKILELSHTWSNSGDLTYSINRDRMLIDNTGDVKISTASKGLILTSPNGTHYRITVSNTGTLKTTLVP